MDASVHATPVVGGGERNPGAVAYQAILLTWYTQTEQSQAHKQQQITEGQFSSNTNSANLSTPHRCYSGNTSFSLLLSLLPVLWKVLYYQYRAYYHGKIIVQSAKNDCLRISLLISDRIIDEILGRSWAIVLSSHAWLNGI